MYVIRFDKFQYIVPDRRYTTSYDFLVHIRKNRARNEDWTAAAAKLRPSFAVAADQSSFRTRRPQQQNLDRVLLLQLTNPHFGLDFRYVQEKFRTM